MQLIVYKFVYFSAPENYGTWDEARRRRIETQERRGRAEQWKRKGTTKSRGCRRKDAETYAISIRNLGNFVCPLTKSVVKNTFKREKKKRFKIFVRRKRINADKNNTHTNSTTHSRIKCYFSNNLYTIRFLWVLVSMRCRSYLFRGSAWNWKEKGSLKPWNDINQHRLHRRKDRG